MGVSTVIQKDSTNDNLHHDILVITDSRNFKETVSSSFSGAKGNFCLSYAESPTAALHSLAADRTQLVLLDLSTSGVDGLDELSRLRQAHAKVPVIVIADAAPNEMALEFIRGGAHECLAKEPKVLAALPRIVSFAIERHQMVIQNRQLIGERDRAEILFSRILSIVEDAVMLIDRNEIVHIANASMLRLIGIALPEMLGKPLNRILPGDRALKTVARLRASAKRSGETVLAPVELDGIAGPTLYRARCTAIELHAKYPSYLISFAADHTQSAEKQGSAKAEAGEGAVDATVAGRIQLVGLESVRTNLGERWAPFAATARDTARDIIRARLSPGDTFKETPSGDFLLIYADGDEEAAWRSAQLISREVENAIFAAAKDIDDQGTLSDEDLDRAARVDSDAATLEIGEGGSIATGELADAIVSKLKKAADQLEWNTRAMLRDVQKSGRPSYRPLMTAARKRSPIAAFCLDDRSQAMIDRLVSQPDNENDSRQKVDMIVFDKATDLLIDTSETEVPLLCIDVSYALLESPGDRANLLAACRGLHTQMKRRLGFCVVGVPRGVQGEKLQDYIGRLKKFSVLQMVELDAREMLTANIGELGVSVLRIRHDQFYRAALRVDNGGKALVRRVQDAGARLLVSDVPGKAQSIELEKANVDLIWFRTT